MGQRGGVSLDTYLFKYKSSDLHYLTKMGMSYLKYVLNMGQLTHLLTII